MGRFLNADAFASTGQGILGNNMFAYCRNNPVMRCDPTGELDWGTLFEGASLLSIGLTACLAAATVITGGACAPLFAAAVVTFVAGGITVMNGAAEVIESTTDYNYMRDGLYRGNERLYETQKNFYSTVAEIGTAVLGVASQDPSLCFVAGTMILASEGAKAIETIEAGDYVWAWDEKTGEVALKEVVETYVNETDELVHVFVNGEEIVTTPSHPFYSPVKGWTEAVHLRAGDILVLVNGEYVVVEKVQHEILETPITVYNFQVADFHTYYVTDTGVLVHNICARQLDTTGTGQKHHPFSNPIVDAAQSNPNLRGIVTRNGGGTIIGLNPESHRGYQTWHRIFDQTAVDWIYNNPEATVAQFVKFMNELYATDTAVSRFGIVWFE